MKFVVEKIRIVIQVVINDKVRVGIKFIVGILIGANNTRRMEKFIVGILIGGGTLGRYISTMTSRLFIKTWLGRQVVGIKFDFGKTTGWGRTATRNRNILSSSLLVNSRMISFQTWVASTRTIGDGI